MQKKESRPIQNQEKVWEKIAEKWDKSRGIPSPTVINFLKNKKGKILDVGSGSGRNFPALNKNAEIYAVDFSEKMLKFAEKNAERLRLNVKTFCFNSDSLPFKDNFFDSAICIAILHCIPEKQKRQKTISELYRTLKPESQALISVWGKNSPRLKNKAKECFIPWASAGQERYTYIYGRNELETEVKNAGLKIVRSWEERNVNIIAEK